MNELSRREREKLRHRREILQAAERLFSTKGYHGTTVQAIANESEFSIGALYNLFENKEDLYFRLIEMRAEEYYRSIYSRMNAAPHPLEKVRSVIRAKLEFFGEHTRFLKIFHRLASDARSEAPTFLSRTLRDRELEYQSRLKAVILEGIQQGVIPNQNPLLAVLCLEGVTNAVIGRWIYTGRKEAPELRSGDLETIIFHGILGKGEEHP